MTESQHPLDNKLLLGRYRVIAMPAHRPAETIVTGLPTSDVDSTLLRVTLIFSVVGAAALIGGTTAGFLIIRHQLAPLARVSDAARQVADELEREFAMAWEWDGHTLRFTRAGVAGSLVVTAIQ